MFTLGNKVRTPGWNCSLWKLNSGLVNAYVFKPNIDALLRKPYKDEQTFWG